MYNDTKTASDRVKNRTITERPTDETKLSKTTLIVLAVVVVLAFLMAGHYDFQAIQAGI